MLQYLCQEQKPILFNILGKPPYLHSAFAVRYNPIDVRYGTFELTPGHKGNFDLFMNTNAIKTAVSRSMTTTASPRRIFQA